MDDKSGSLSAKRSTRVKVGTFRIAGGRKQGGNVACYFCTPDGRVLHAVVGPVNAAVMLLEARWAVGTWKPATLKRQDSGPALQIVGYQPGREGVQRLLVATVKEGVLRYVLHFVQNYAETQSGLAKEDCKSITPEELVPL